MTANCGLIGAHLTGTTDGAVSSITLEIENLAEFLEKDQPAHIDRHDKQWIFNERYDQIASSFDSDGFRLSIRMRRQEEFKRRRASHLAAVQSIPQVRIEADAPCSLDEFDAYVKAFADFATFVADQPSAIVKYTGETAAGDSFEVVQQMTVQADLDRAPQHQWRFRLFADDVELDKVLPAWLRLWVQSRPAIDLMISAKLPGGFIEFNALALAVAVERLHQALESEATVRSAEDFSAARARIVGAIRASVEQGLCEENDVTWVRDILRNDLSFPKRAKALAERTDPAALAKVLPGVDAWVKALKESRNGLAHSGGGGDRESLQLLIEQTRWLLAIVLMQEIGVPAARQLATEAPLELLKRLANRT